MILGECFEKFLDRSPVSVIVRILVEVISDSGERDQVPRPRTLESVTLL